MRGEGISLRAALERCRYAELRPGIDADDLIDSLKADPDLVTQWIMYCEDKRTSDGWYLNPGEMEIGRLFDQSSVNKFETIEETVAHYIIHELDYWVALNEGAARK